MLTFVARRLQAESVALLFASRNDPAMDVRLAGLATLRLEGLDPAPAVALLQQVPGLPDRSRGGRSHRPGHRRQPAGVDRSRP